MREELVKESELLEESARLLNVRKSVVPARAEELFGLWKEVVKKKRQKGFVLTSMVESAGSDKDILEQTARILKTQVEHVPKTLARFIDELEKEKQKR